MSAYQHVLFATDYSELASPVATKAQLLAEKNNAKLSIVHIMHDAPKNFDEYETAIPLNIDLDDGLIDAHKQSMGAIADQLGIADENRWLGAGDAAQQIVEIAKELAVDLIVIGSHGRHGLSLLLGSTANAVLHHSPCDVIAVRLK